MAGGVEQDTDHIGSAEHCAEREDDGYNREDDGYNREDLRDHGDREQGTRMRGLLTKDFFLNETGRKIVRYINREGAE